MDEKFVLVTGAFGSLGKAVVNELLEAGYYVFGCDVLADESINHDNFIPLQIDITDLESVEQVYEFISQYTEVLDAVVNLAGIFDLDSIVEGSPVKLRKIIETNFFGTYYINQGSLPFLAVDTSKIINVVSEIADYSASPFNGYYEIPNAMLDKYSDCLRRELNFIGIKVIKVKTGLFNTTLFNNTLRNIDILASKTEIYQKHFLQIKSLLEEEIENSSNPGEFAEAIVSIVDSQNPKPLYEININRKLKKLNKRKEELLDKYYLSKMNDDE